MPGSHSHRQLGILSVALITYFNVSGGPWGSEPVLAACGPFVGILAVLLFPWVWCLPLALTFAELFTAFPTDGSFCKWVGVAFGRPMGFHVGYWSWVSGVIDNAIYPCLIVDTLLALTLGDKDAMNGEGGVAWSVFAMRAAFAVLFMLPTLRSIKVVGHTLLVLGVMIFLPFAVLIIYAMPLIEPANWFVIRKDRDWGRLLSSLYWNYSGFDAAGAYIIPFIAIAGADMPHYTTWDDGSYSVIAQKIGGTWLCIWVLISSVFGNLGLYVAEMAKDGFQLAGMADSGLAPPYFAHHPAGILHHRVHGLFDFDTILGIDNFLSALASLVEMSAAVRMRFSHPEIERPYRVNLSDRSLLVAMMLPFTLGVFIMVNELTKSWTSLLLNGIALTFGYLIQKYIERHPYHKYAEIIGVPKDLSDLSEELELLASSQ
ncbi:Amino acid/polyamine transporter I [Phytophthora cactorum]|nr:Amino acid/polyamine transporter I [Phytophthora cactorum]